MNTFKKILTGMLCIAMLASIASVGMTVSAEEESGALTSIRWFPVPTEKQNDDAWEVECVADGCLCQRFTETAEDTGNTNFLDTSYDENGALTLTRNETPVSLNGADTTSWYWPRIRTVSLETSPEFDLATANTLYFDITAHGATQWNLTVGFNGMIVSLGKFMAAAAGSTVDPKDPSVTDAPAGTFKGSINLNDTIAEIAATSALGTDCTNAQAIKNMKKCFVPQVMIYVVGDTSSSLTINELYVSTADDTTGENCTFIDMGVLTGLGDEYYELMANDDAAEGDASEGDASEGDAAEGDASEEDTDNTTTTTKKDDKDQDEGGSALPIVIAVVAVVVVAAVVVIVLMKKKKA